MAQERPLTPEKQLLKIIEDPQARSRVGVVLGATRVGSLFSFGAWVGRFSFFKERCAKLFKGGRSYPLDNLKAINRILEAGIFILVFYLVTSLFFFLINFKKMPNLKFKMPSVAVSPSFKESTLLRSPAYYLEKVRERNIFKMGAKNIPLAARVPEGQESKIKKLTGGLKLVGISWSDDPDAMVEDTETARTFFIKRGQMIGEVKVRAIFKDRVILSYFGEEVELK